jgi:hypothetical protein
VTFYWIRQTKLIMAVTSFMMLQTPGSVFCAVDEMASWRNGKLSKWQVDEMASWRNGKLMKWQVDEMASWQNDLEPFFVSHFSFKLTTPRKKIYWSCSQKTLKSCGCKTFWFGNEGKSAASCFRQVAALFPDMFWNFYLVKNHKIAENSTTTTARVKISTELESLEF